MTAVHQFLPSLARGDAIGQHAMRLRSLLRDAGIDSELFAEEVHPTASGEAHDYTRYGDFVPNDGRMAMLYHLSTGSAMADFLRAQPWPLLIDYHNITEPRFFDRWEPVAADRAREAREELARLAPRTTCAIAHSRFSEDELIARSFARTLVLPLLLDVTALDGEPDTDTMRHLQRARERGPSGTCWLFVGRVAPNKAHHDIIAAFAVYRRLIDPHAHLTFVGGMTSMRYRRALDQLVGELGVGAAITFADSVPLPVLRAHYRSADVFVCLSDHEGFMVPVVEAMHCGVPVVAFASTAVPETVGDAALVLASKDPLIVAAGVDRVMRDNGLRSQLIAAGYARVAELTGDSVAASWREMLTSPDVMAGEW